MADHLKPTITSIYSDFVAEMDARFDDLAVGLDPSATTATNVTTNAIRWISTSNKWQKYNGSTWSDLSSLYSINISGNAGTVTNGVYTNGSYSNPTWITALAGSKITGDIAGNSSTATALATARNINGVAFNGTAAISVNLNNSVIFNNTGTGGASGASFNGGNGLTVSYNTIGAPSTTGVDASGTWGINISGNAATVTNGVYNNSGTYSINITGRAYPRRSDGSDLNFNWSGQSGQPPWLWGGSDGNEMYVYNPSNFNVNYANSAGTTNYATNAGNASTVSSVSTSQVLNATAAASAGAVGTYALAMLVSGPSTAVFNSTTSGSNLRNSAAGLVGGGGALSGTWRCMGLSAQAADSTGVTLWLRIS